MVSVGIDVGGHSHAVARCRDGLSKADREIVRVSQSRAGFDALDARLARQPEPVRVVTMESSGHFWLPVASHLHRAGVDVSLVNPLEAKYFARSRLARTKSDPADARNLAEMAMGDPRSPRDPPKVADSFNDGRVAQLGRGRWDDNPGPGRHDGAMVSMPG